MLQGREYRFFRVREQRLPDPDRAVLRSTKMAS